MYKVECKIKLIFIESITISADNNYACAHIQFFQLTHFMHYTIIKAYNTSIKASHKMLKLFNKQQSY